MYRQARQRIYGMGMVIMAIGLLLTAGSNSAKADLGNASVVTITGYTNTNDAFVFSRNSTTGYLAVTVTFSDSSQKNYVGYIDPTFIVNSQSIVTVDYSTATPGAFDETTCTTTVTNPTLSPNEQTGSPPPQTVPLSEIP